MLKIHIFHLFLTVLNLYRYRNTYGHVVNLLPEGEGHPAPDDHLVHLVQHVLNQLYLVLNLSSEENKTISNNKLDDNRL